MKHRSHYELIAREGYPFFVPLGVLAVIALIAGYSWSAFVLLLLCTAVALFFRNPERVSPLGDNLILSPADGTVVEIVENAESAYVPDAQFTRISIFMSVFNVHVNRWPISGIVKKITHVRGAFLDARDPNASLANEHNSIVLAGDETTIEVVQIAGKVARRIACWVSEGDRAYQGERFGLIRFGSRLDVYVPSAFEIQTKIGEKTVAGLTVLAIKK